MRSYLKKILIVIFSYCVPNHYNCTSLNQPKKGILFNTGPSLSSLQRAIYMYSMCTIIPYIAFFFICIHRWFFCQWEILVTSISLELVSRRQDNILDKKRVTWTYLCMYSIPRNTNVIDLYDIIWFFYVVQYADTLYIIWNHPPLRCNCLKCSRDKRDRKFIFGVIMLVLYSLFTVYKHI